MIWLIAYGVGMWLTLFGLIVYDEEFASDAPSMIGLGLVWPIAVAVGLIVASLWPAVYLSRWLRTKGNT